MAGIHRHLLRDRWDKCSSIVHRVQWYDMVLYSMFYNIIICRWQKKTVQDIIYLKRTELVKGHGSPKLPPMMCLRGFSLPHERPKFLGFRDDQPEKNSIWEDVLYHNAWNNQLIWLIWVFTSNLTAKTWKLIVCHAWELGPWPDSLSNPKP